MERDFLAGAPTQATDDGKETKQQVTVKKARKTAVPIATHMQIIGTKVLNGPNFWSNYRQQLIEMKLDIGKYEELPSNEIPGFYERLMRLLPSLETHRCSRDKHGGLCERIQEGTWMGHIIEHVALELQCLAGMDCGFGRTRGAGRYGVYKVVFSYLSATAGKYAGKAAVELVEAIAENRAFNLKQVIQQLEDIWRREAFGPSTQSIIDEAKSRNIPVTRMNDQSLVLLGQGANQQLFCATVMGTTGSLGVELASDKWGTKELLGENGIPVPRGRIVSAIEELDEALSNVGYPVAIKPVDGNHGRGITTMVTNRAEAVKAFRAAVAISDDVIVEQHITGDDYRFLLVNYKLIAVAKRTPAHIVGDGLSTIQALIDVVNAHPDRGCNHEKTLTKISVDRQTKTILKAAGLTTDSILPMGKRLFLKKTANLSTGGTSTDVTDLVHPRTVFMAERIARLMRLDVCGIDVMAQDISLPLTEANGAIIEVNAGPGFRMHTAPSEGTPRNVAKPVIDMLFPNNATGRIPVVAVTGTNGKTTTTRLIAHIAKAAGRTAGYTTTDGININDQLLTKGDCSGPKSARLILRDPTVDYAVLECARGGILRSGLGFDKCNISIVTNISEDHMGVDDIHDMDTYTRVKEVVPRSTFDDGFAILNADDDRVYSMREVAPCQVVLFSTDSNNPRITKHCANGGIAVTIENGDYLIIEGEKRTRVLPVNDIPLTFSGEAEFMVMNILPALGAAYLSGFGLSVIRQALRSFKPSPSLTPGRMNLFDFEKFKVMLDYAHNEAGFLQIEKYMANVNASRKVGIIAATGDRRDDDIRSLGRNAARIFDEIIIRHDKNSRGRSNDEMTCLILEGINSIDQHMPVKVISDEAQAIHHAITYAREDAFIFACADDVWESIAMIDELHSKHKVSTHSLIAS